MDALPHYFIGIPVPNELREKLSVWQEHLKTLYPFKQWTFKDDFHITLRFLGPVSENNILTLGDMLKQLENQTAFSLDVRRISFFGNQNRPRVLLAEVEKNTPLTMLYEYVEAYLEYIGYSKETRPYRPHITLAKKWNNSSVNRQRFDKLDKYLKQSVTLRVNNVALYQVFPKQKPKYKVVYRYSLRGETDGTTD